MISFFQIQVIVFEKGSDGFYVLNSNYFFQKTWDDFYFLDSNHMRRLQTIFSFLIHSCSC